MAMDMYPNNNLNDALKVEDSGFPGDFECQLQAIACAFNNA